MDIQSAFFVIYPRREEKEASKVLKSITDHLLIDYSLWSYASVRKASADYFQETVVPSVEKAQFVLALLAKGSGQDFLLDETLKFCFNLNKRVIPVKIGEENLKETKWTFRSEILDFNQEAALACGSLMS